MHLYRSTSMCICIPVWWFLHLHYQGSFLVMPILRWTTFPLLSASRCCFWEFKLRHIASSTNHSVCTKLGGYLQLYDDLVQAMHFFAPFTWMCLNFVLSLCLADASPAKGNQIDVFVNLMRRGNHKDVDNIVFRLQHWKIMPGCPSNLHDTCI